MSLIETADPRAAGVPIATASWQSRRGTGWTSSANDYGAASPMKVSFDPVKRDKVPRERGSDFDDTGKMFDRRPETIAPIMAKSGMSPAAALRCAEKPSGR